jgi:hypothetical protein
LERSSSRTSAAAWADRTALAGLVAGIALYLVPAEGALRWGFWITLGFTVVHMVTSRLRSPG